MPKKYVVEDFALRLGRARTGRGLFALEDIPKGACILEYFGRTVTGKEKRLDRGKYYFWVSDTRMIDGNVRGNRARFINHSCAPNCEAQGPDGRVFIVTLRKIRTGEELTFDYGEEYFDKHIGPKGCRCAKCEKPRLRRPPPRKAAPRAANGKALRAGR